MVLTGSSKIFQSIPSHSKPFHVWWMLTRRLSCPRPISCISCQDDKAHEKLHPLMSSKTYIYRVITHFQAQDLLKHYTVAYHQKKNSLSLGTIRGVRILNPRSRLKKSNHTLPVTSYSLRLDQGTSRRYCWWFRSGSRSPVELGSLSYYLQGFYTSNRWLGMGVLNHQQYREVWWSKNSAKICELYQIIIFIGLPPNRRTPSTTHFY